MRLSHRIQAVFKVLHSLKIGCGTSISTTAFSRQVCSIALLQRECGLAFPCPSWYIFGR